MLDRQFKWIFFISLSIIWGSSFILMKWAMPHLTAIQVGALRIIIAGFFLLFTKHQYLKGITKKEWIYLFFVAITGTFLPSFLFTISIQHIDSSIVAILNSFTPLNTLLIGFLFFKYRFNKSQIFGIIIGILGTVILVRESAVLNPLDNYWYALPVIVATLGYAINVNLIKKYLSRLDPISIAVANFLLVLLPALVVLIFSGFFKISFNTEVLISLGYTAILAILGTAIALMFFYKMIQITSPLFASSVTYTIPIVALLWGILDQEQIHLSQILSGLIILLGVYLVNKN